MMSKRTVDRLFYEQKRNDDNKRKENKMYIFEKFITPDTYNSHEIFQKILNDYTNRTNLNLISFTMTGCNDENSQSIVYHCVFGKRKG